MFPLPFIYQDGDELNALDSEVKEGHGLVSEMDKMVQDSKHEKKIDIKLDAVDKEMTKARKSGDETSDDEIPGNDTDYQYGHDAVRTNGGKVQKEGDKKSAEDPIYEPRVDAVIQDTRKMEKLDTKKKQDVSTVFDYKLHICKKSSRVDCNLQAN